MDNDNMKICECECDECQECEYNYEYDYDKECYPRPPRRMRPNRTVLKCGNGGGANIPEGTPVGPTSNYILTSLTVDTKCIKKPIIKFEFASNIVTTATATGDPIIGLTFQLLRQCKNQIAPMPVGPGWTFSRTGSQASSDTFTFFVCDCNYCYDDCCTYSVSATVTAGESTSNATQGSTIIQDASLAALIVEDGTCC